MQNKILSFISLASKAGKTASGEFSVESAIKNGKASLVIIAEDASDNTKKKFSNMCDFRKIKYFIYADKESLGKVCGKDERACVAICDKGFADNLKKFLTEVEI